MKRSFWTGFLSLWMLLSGCTDDETGQSWLARLQGAIPAEEQLMQDRIQRIITLDQGMTDIIYNAGGGGYIVGVSEHERFGMFPDSTARIRMNPLDLTQIHKLKPDLIVGTEGVTRQTKLDSLEKAGFQVKSFTFNEWRDVPNAIKLFGRTLGTEFRADEAVDSLWAQWKTVRTLLGHYKPSVLLISGNRDLLAFGQDSHINALINDGGGFSLTTQLSGGKQVVDAAFVQQKNPDYLFITPSLATNLRQLERKHPFVTSLRAYRKKRIYLVPPEVFLYPSPRFVEGAKEVAQILFSDLIKPLQ